MGIEVGQILTTGNRRQDHGVGDVVQGGVDPLVAGQSARDLSYVVSQHGA